MFDSTRMFLQWLTSALFAFILIFSYPHFIWSYRCAYQQGFDFIRRHFLALVVAPIVLLTLILVCIMTWSQPVTVLPWVSSADNTLRSFGFDLHWSSYRSCGQLLLANLFICQTIMAVQHYCMQAYGVALQGGSDEGLKISTRQKLLLRLNLYALAAMNLFSGYTFFAFFNTSNFVYHPVQFPQVFGVIAIVFFFATGALLILKIVVPIYRKTSKLPPMAASVPVLSVWLWLQPFNQPFGYQAWVVPLAHGAQYLFFALRIENARFDANMYSRLPKIKGSRILFIMVISLSLIGIGFLSFNYLPVLFDQQHFVPGLNGNFFLLAAFVCLSLHHYFVDAVVWKHDSQAKALLQNSLKGSPGA
ncbi:MAG: hypothetical protein P4L53_01980 [Candidatus Obscuribacterales bacterium]|nr:hypothetical protein [Candidatus Obscuribacterales bacterium]